MTVSPRQSRGASLGTFGNAAVTGGWFVEQPDGVPWNTIKLIGSGRPHDRRIRNRIPSDKLQVPLRELQAPVADYHVLISQIRTPSRDDSEVTWWPSANQKLTI